MSSISALTPVFNFWISYSFLCFTLYSFLVLEWHAGSQHLIFRLWVSANKVNLSWELGVLRISRTDRINTLACLSDLKRIMEGEWARCRQKKTAENTRDKNTNEEIEGILNCGDGTESEEKVLCHPASEAWGHNILRKLFFEYCRWTQ